MKYGIAALLSAILPGIGQFYNRNWLKGFFFLGTILVLAGLLQNHLPVSALKLGEPIPFTGADLILSVLILVVGAWSVFDAYRDARKNIPS